MHVPKNYIKIYANIDFVFFVFIFIYIKFFVVSVEFARRASIIFEYVSIEVVKCLFYYEL